MSMPNAEAIAEEWIAAWNAHDLERVLALFAEDYTMTSPKIQAFGHGGAGVVSGKAALRTYWRDALDRQPDLRFTHVETFAGPDCATVVYDDMAGRRVAEFLRWDGSGSVVQAVALHRCA